VVVSDQLKHRQFFRRIKLPNHGFIQVPGVAWKMKGQNEVEDCDLFPVAPRLGEHTHTVFI
jgi:crotonobetainyl-CoA:carnitine CoA-transferase CaiB-like acyl-CoA transferase